MTKGERKVWSHHPQSCFIGSDLRVGDEGQEVLIGFIPFPPDSLSLQKEVCGMLHYKDSSMNFDVSSELKPRGKGGGSSRLKVRLLGIQLTSLGAELAPEEDASGNDSA